MTTVAQGLLKQTKLVKQSALGSPGSSGSQLLRRTQGMFTATRAKFSNNEIVAHQQGTGDIAGIKQTSGKLDGVLSPGSYSKMFGSLLRADFASVTPITSAGVTIAGSGPTIVTMQDSQAA